MWSSINKDNILCLVKTLFIFELLTAECEGNYVNFTCNNIDLKWPPMFMNETSAKFGWCEVKMADVMNFNSGHFGRCDQKKFISLNADADIAELENLFWWRKSWFCSVEMQLILPLFPLQRCLRWNCSIFSSPADVWSPLEAKPNTDVLESSLPRSNAVGVVCVKDLYFITSHVLRAIIKSCSSPCDMRKIEQSLPADHKCSLALPLLTDNGDF